MNFLQKIKDDKILNIISKLDNEVYLVGGAVRDFYMNKSTCDRDLIVCDADAREFALNLADMLDAVFVPLDEVNKIYRLVLPDKINYIDITNPIENSLKSDLLRRDLTINAIAVNIKSLDIVDYVGGIEDLKKRIISVISEKNILDDPLRILRVFRFYSVLGFDIDEKTLDIVKKHVSLITKPARERVLYELMKLASGEFFSSTIILMDKYGLLELIFPFVSELKQVPKNSHHHLDLFHHSVETANQVQLMYACSSDNVKSHLDKIDFGGFSRLAHLKLAAFMHDIGKFSTWTIEGDRHRFIKHDDVGSKLAVDILKNMCFSNKQINYISSMIKYHIYPSNVVSSPDLNEKIMMRFVRKMSDNAIDVILLAIADRLSAQGPDITPEIIANNINSLDYLLNFYIDKCQNLKPLPKLLDGNDVMKILNIQPSPLLGEVMEQLHEAQISGDVVSKDDAIAFVSKLKRH